MFLIKNCSTKPNFAKYVFIIRMSNFQLELKCMFETVQFDVRKSNYYRQYRKIQHRQYDQLEKYISGRNVIENH